MITIEKNRIAIENNNSNLANIMIIGMQKCATTWLAKKLSEREDTFVYDFIKEIHFFEYKVNYNKGYDWYNNFFKSDKKYKYYVDKSPNYLYGLDRPLNENHLSNVHELMHKYNPDAKLIISFKNPIKRAISALRHFMSSGDISPLHNTYDLLFGKHKNIGYHNGIIEYGFYYKHLKNLYKFFPKEQVLIFFLEDDIFANPETSVKKLYDFIDDNKNSDSIKEKQIEPELQLSFTDIKNYPNTKKPIQKKVNKNQSGYVGTSLYHHFPKLKKYLCRLDKIYPKIPKNVDERVLKKLYEIYKPENEKLFSLIGRETNWKKPENLTLWAR